MGSSTEVQAFFLPAEPGSRFALFYPASGKPVRGAFLYAHPFAEEMNKSRRMAALQARAFAAANFAVLQIDLFGCGDSSGDLADARWEIWKRDLRMAAEWLAQRVAAPIHLWGLRLGAPLALDLWRDHPLNFASALLWQPVMSGNGFVAQFLRLAVAGEALRDGGNVVTTDALRKRMFADETIEVAGYALAPALIAAIDGLTLADLAHRQTTLHWLDVRNGDAREPPLAAQKVLGLWQTRLVAATYAAVPGNPFWMTQEISEAPQLISASLACYENSPS